ncbi:hypothetical protein OFB78_30295, partial [Escherichia coli]|nr:hypothetical protein [Escherichia coli]
MNSSLDPSSEEHDRSRRNSVPAHQQLDRRGGMDFHSLEATTVQKKKKKNTHQRYRSRGACQ